MSDSPRGFEPHHMNWDDFRRHAHELVDWIVDYYGRIEDLPVLSRAEPGQLRAALPTEPPRQGESFEAMLRDVDEHILPGLTHWQSPNFFAFFPANASAPAMLGELLSAALGVQGMLWTTSPACTELETHVLDWLVDMLDLPEAFKSTSDGGGVIQDTASSATLCALLAARQRVQEAEPAGKPGEEAGALSRMVAYTSTQAHSSVEKAARIAGFHPAHLRSIEVDEAFALRPDVLAEQIRADLAAGLIPCFVCANLGTTSSEAIDPLPAIGKICHEYKVWLHADAAMAGTAALCPEFRFVHEGLEYVDSYCFNPHKWMFTNFDCDAFYVRDRSVLVRTLSVLPEYLRNAATESGKVFDYRDWHIPLGRRFRALKLWFVIRHYGVEGLQAHIREHVRLAQWFRDEVASHSDFELMAPAPLNLVCFRHRGSDEVNEQLMNRLNDSGDLYLTHTKLSGKFTLRLCVGQTYTEERHVHRAWRRIVEEADKLG